MSPTPTRRLSFVHWTGIVAAIAIAVLFALSDKPVLRVPKGVSAMTAKPAAAFVPKMEQPSSPSWEEMERITERLNRQDRRILSMIPV